MATTLTLYSTKSRMVDDTYPNQAIMEFVVDQSIEDNTSTINWTLKAGGSNPSQMGYWCDIRFRYGTTEGNYDYNDYTYLYKTSMTSSFSVYSQQIISYGSFTVNHNLDGTKKIMIYFDGRSDSVDYPGILTRSNGMEGDFRKNALELPTIPRASTVSCTTVEIGRNPTININSPSTAFTHTLRYKFGTFSGTIATGLKGGNYNNWTIPLDFLGEITEKYGEGTIYCDTYNSNGVLNGTKSTVFRVNIPSTYGPNISPTIKNIDSKTLSLTGNDPDKIVQFYNKISYDIGAFTSTGATITSVKITCGNKSASTMTGTLTNVESNVFVITVTDSRGFTTTETYYKTLIPYIKLTAKLQLISIDTNGSGSIAISGNMFWASFGAVENQPTISYRWKEEGGSWSNWTNVVYNVINDSYYVNVEFYNLDYQKTYIYEAKAVDQLMTVEPEQLVVKCMPVFDWNNDDFQFNVPVTITGDLVVTGNVTSANNPEAMGDFIVEQGTVTTGSGNSTANWVYRKWSSGVAECWCRKHISTAVNTAWGNLYVSGAISYTNITWGVDFIDIPVANITIAPNGSGAFLIAGGSTTLTQSNTGGYEIARGSALTSAGSFYINYYGIGRWK